MSSEHGNTARQLIEDGGPSKGTCEKLLDASIEPFYRHGVHAVALDVILSVVGTTKPK